MVPTAHYMMGGVRVEGDTPLLWVLRDNLNLTLLAILCALLMLLPLVTTFDDFLTTWALQFGANNPLQAIVPIEARIDRDARAHQRHAGLGAGGVIPLAQAPKKTIAAQDACRQAMGHGLKEVEVLVKGPGAGRDGRWAGSERTMSATE